MDQTQDVKQRYSKLKDGLANLNIGKAKAETRLEAAEKQKTEALDVMEKIAGTRDVEEARTKLKGLGKKLEEKLKEAEAILNDPETTK